jgi:hypothetical protein
MKATQRVPAVRGELTDDLGANTDSCDGIPLPPASVRRNIMLKGLGIRECPLDVTPERRRNPVFVIIMRFLQNLGTLRGFVGGFRGERT